MSDAKWCSYCEKDTHNDAECWCTRPAQSAPHQSPVMYGAGALIDLMKNIAAKSPAEQVSAPTSNQSAVAVAQETVAASPAPAAGPSAVEEALPASVQKAIDAHARWYSEYHHIGLAARDDMMHIAALARAAERESAATPNETVLQAVQRVLDESSAWIAMPNKDVEKRLAIASGFAWRTELDRLRAENERLRVDRSKERYDLRQRSDRAEAALRVGVVVPEEPTPAMLEAACRVIFPNGETQWPGIHDAARRYYKAMLAAAKEKKT